MIAARLVAIGGRNRQEWEDLLEIFLVELQPSIGPGQLEHDAIVVVVDLDGLGPGVVAVTFGGDVDGEHGRITTFLEEAPGRIGYLHTPAHGVPASCVQSLVLANALKRNL